VIRNPRMQGLPLRLPGSTVMRFKRSEVIEGILGWPIGAGKGGRKRCQPPNLGSLTDPPVTTARGRLPPGPTTGGRALLFLGRHRFFMMRA
jgi:hypothetical protein